MQPKVDHLAFVVKELDRSVKFYQDLFGGEVGRSRGFNEKDQKAGRPRSLSSKSERWRRSVRRGSEIRPTQRLLPFCV
jgi:catechol 2,3-dioxygenase-like lactoylglutathione lyase family enzyme